jgi:hypothetical protein
MTRSHPAGGPMNRPIMRSGAPRGGLTTKTHALGDGRGLPLVIVLTPGLTAGHAVLDLPATPHPPFTCPGDAQLTSKCR